MRLFLWLNTKCLATLFNRYSHWVKTFIGYLIQVKQKDPKGHSHRKWHESFARYFISRNYSNILKLMIYWFLNLEFLNKVIHDIFCLSSWHFSPELTLYAHNTPEKSALLKTSPQGDEGKQGEDTLSLSQHFLWCKTGRGFCDLGAKL